VGIALRHVTERLIAWVEASAQANKFGYDDIVRIINFYAFDLLTENRANGSIDQVRERCKSYLRVALDRVIEASLTSALPQLINFVDDANKALEQCELSEISYHVSRSRLAQVMKATSEIAIHKALSKLKENVEMQTAPFRPATERLLSELRDAMVRRYARYAFIVESGYGDIITPVPAQVYTLANMLAPPQQ